MQVRLRAPMNNIQKYRLLSHKIKKWDEKDSWAPTKYISESFTNEHHIKHDLIKLCSRLDEMHGASDWWNNQLQEFSIEAKQILKTW